jgi:phosphoglycerol transferase
MKGREADAWQKEISSQDLPAMTRNLSFAGFNGIYVDSFGYTKPDEIVNSLSSTLNTKPIVSGDKRLYFFSMVEYNRRLRANMSAAEWDAGMNSVFKDHPNHL